MLLLALYQDTPTQTGVMNNCSSRLQSGYNKFFISYTESSTSTINDESINEMLYSKKMPKGKNME